MTHFDRNFNLEAIVEDVKLKERVVAFLESKDFKKELERYCFGFHQKLDLENRLKDFCFEPLFVNLSLKFGEIEDADLLYLITKESKHFKNLVEEAALYFIKGFFETSGSAITVRKEQIHCVIRFYELPLIPEFYFSLKKVHINCALSTFHCILSSKTPAEQYIRQSVWKCTNCSGSSFIIRKSSDPGEKASCQICLNECSEIKTHRVTSTFCSVRVFEVESFKSRKRLPSITSSIELKLYDDLCQELQLGLEYIVCGIFEPLKNFYNVWSIVPAIEV